MNAGILDQLLERAAWSRRGDVVVTADEVAEWPAGQLDSLLLDGALKEIQPATSVECDGCLEGHVEPVEWVEEPPGSGLRGYIACPDAGRVRIDPARLRRWRFLQLTQDDAAEPPAPTSRGGPTIFSNDYHYAERDGRSWTLSDKQAELMRILDQGFRRGDKLLAWHAIRRQLDEAGQPAASMRDVLRGIDDWELLITHPKRGYWGLRP